jgi:hypothetical protein
MYYWLQLIHFKKYKNIFFTAKILYLVFWQFFYVRNKEFWVDKYPCFAFPIIVSYK